MISGSESNWNTVLSLLEAPGAKTLPFVHHRGAYSVLPIQDNFCKPTPAKQVVVAVIVVLSNICHAWTMYLCMDPVKFLLEAPGASILFCDNLQAHLGALLLGRALLIGTLV